jgi:hypothetical protein
MNDTMMTSTVTLPITSSSMSDTITIGSATGITTYGSIAIGVLTDDLLDKYEFNKLTVDHKVSAHELLKLKDTVPTYADEIKENLAKNASRELVKKITFTKKHDVDSDVHHFIGRVWVFTEEELRKLIEEVKHA